MKTSVSKHTGYYSQKQWDREIGWGECPPEYTHDDMLKEAQRVKREQDKLKDKKHDG